MISGFWEVQKKQDAELTKNFVMKIAIIEMLPG
jgi:hypothetical protein